MFFLTFHHRPKISLPQLPTFNSTQWDKVPVLVFEVINIIILFTWSLLVIFLWCFIWFWFDKIIPFFRLFLLSSCAFTYSLEWEIKLPTRFVWFDWPLIIISLLKFTFFVKLGSIFTGIIFLKCGYWPVYSNRIFLLIFFYLNFMNIFL